MLALAGFDASNPKSYFVPRACLGTSLLVSLPPSLTKDLPTEPPAELVREVFPWVWTEYEAYESRLGQDWRKYSDPALQQFLITVKWMSKVDGAGKRLPMTGQLKSRI